MTVSPVYMLSKYLITFMVLLVDKIIENMLVQHKLSSIAGEFPNDEIKLPDQTLVPLKSWPEEVINITIVPEKSKVFSVVRLNFEDHRYFRIRNLTR